MRLVLLPGNTKRDKAWMQEAALSFLPISHSISMHHYDHWSSNKKMDMKKEISSLSKHYGRDPQLVLVARAEGVSLGLEAMKKGKMWPMACVFIDSPRKVKKEIAALELPVFETSNKNLTTLVENSTYFLSNLT